VYLLNSLNPLRLEGQKTLMFEVLGSLSPDRVVFPVGNGGNISAAHKAMREANATKLSTARPHLTGVQAEGASPLARAWREKRDPAPTKALDASGRPHPQPRPAADTLATAIRIGSPVNAAKAMRAVRDTHGVFTSVPDEAILDAQRRMAATEGLFVEPASAAPLAGLKRLVDEGVVARTESVVLVATGNGLKDPEVVAKFAAPTIRVEATLEALRIALQ
jgi:threonine synthase